MEDSTNKNILDSDSIIDIEDCEEITEDFFRSERVDIDGFPLCSLVISDLMRLQPEVWWLWKLVWWGMAFPVIIASAFAADLSRLAILMVWAWVKRIGCYLIDLVFGAIAPFGKIIMAGAAILIIVLFLYNEGWTGLNDIYKSVAGFLKEVFHA